MPSWKKVITSGSDAVLNSVIATGSLDTINRELIYNDQTVLDWDLHQLAANGVTSVEWDDRTLYDKSAEVSIDWDRRQLKGLDVNVMLDWSGSALLASASIYMSASTQLYGTASYALTASSVNITDFGSPLGPYTVVYKVPFVRNSGSGQTLYVDSDLSYNGNSNILFTTSSHSENAINAISAQTSSKASVISANQSYGQGAPYYIVLSQRTGSEQLYNDYSLSYSTVTDTLLATSSYALTASYLAGATTPTLQQVTDQGNTTTNDVIITGSLYVKDRINSNLGQLTLNNTVLVDWYNSHLINGDDANISVDWQGRYLIDQYGNQVVDWKNQQMYSAFTSLSLDWNSGYLYDLNNNYVSVDWANNRTLRTSQDEASVDWEGGTLYTAINTNVSPSIDWSNRKLIGQYGYGESATQFTAVEWSGSYLTLSGSSIFVKGLTTSSTADVLTFNPTTGQVYYTASNAIGAAAVVPTLQQVTDQGNDTTAYITASGFAMFDGAASDYVTIQPTDSGIQVINNINSTSVLTVQTDVLTFGQPTRYTTFQNLDLTSDRIYKLPDQNGTLLVTPWTGSATFSGSFYLQGLITTSSVSNVLTFNPATGQVYYTASAAIGGGAGSPTTPGGVNNNIQFNYNDTFDGSNNFNYYKGTATIVLTGSLVVSGSTYLQALTTASVNNVLTYDPATGQVYYTASSAIGNPIESDPIFTAWSGSSISQFAGTSSYALTASFVQNAQTASYILPAFISSSLNVYLDQDENDQVNLYNGPALQSVITINNVQSSSFAYTASYALTASFVTASNVYGPYGSNSVLSASFAVSASYARNVLSASFATTASFAQNAQTASLAVTASFTVSASFATTASYVLSSSYAVTAATASHALNTDNASMYYSVQPVKYYYGSFPYKDIAGNRTSFNPIQVISPFQGGINMDNTELRPAYSLWDTGYWQSIGSSLYNSYAYYNSIGDYTPMYDPNNTNIDRDGWAPTYPMFWPIMVGTDMEIDAFWFAARAYTLESLSATTKAYVRCLIYENWQIDTSGVRIPGKLFYDFGTKTLTPQDSNKGTPTDQPVLNSVYRVHTAPAVLRKNKIYWLCMYYTQTKYTWVQWPMLDVKNTINTYFNPILGHMINRGPSRVGDILVPIGALKSTFPFYYEYPDFNTIVNYEDLNDRLPPNPPAGNSPVGFTDPTVASGMYLPVAYGRVDGYPGSWQAAGSDSEGRFGSNEYALDGPPFGYYGQMPPVHPPFLTVRAPLAPYY